MDIMNEPEEPMLNSPEDIVREYLQYKDVKRTAFVFQITTSEVRKILKDAGIKISKK